MAHTDPSRHETAPALSATEARQGTPGRSVLYVLVFALLLALLAWISSEYWGSAIDPQTRKDSPQSTTPEATSKVEGAINNDPLPGEKRQTEPAIVDPQPTGNQ
jgi:hypothetical protein